MALEVEAASGWLRGRLQWRRRWKWRRRWRWRWPPLVSPSLAPARSARDRLRVASPRQRPLCSAEAGEEVRCAARRRRGARRAATRRVDTQSYGLLRAANSSESLAPRPMPSARACARPAQAWKAAHGTPCSVAWSRSRPCRPSHSCRSRHRRPVAVVVVEAAAEAAAEAGTTAGATAAMAKMRAVEGAAAEMAASPAAEMVARRGAKPG